MIIRDLYPLKLVNLKVLSKNIIPKKIKKNLYYNNFLFFYK